MRKTRVSYLQTVGWLSLCLALLLALPACAEEPYTFLSGDTEGTGFDLSFDLIANDAALRDWSGELVCCYVDASHFYTLRLTQQKAGFYKVNKGTVTPLGFAGIPAWSRSPHQIRIKKRGWKLTALVDLAVCTVAYDDEYAEGKAGHRAVMGAPRPENPRFQPVEPIAFSDDFMRSGSQVGTWETVSGDWRNTVLADRDPARSANAFSYVGRSKEKALAVSGFPFWSDYVADASTKVNDQGATGLAFYYSDPQNHYLFRWTSALSTAPDGNRRQLWRIVRGQARLLKEAPGGQFPGQWYKIRVKTCDGQIAAYIDDREVLRAEDASLGQGKVGLFTENTEGAHFDDVFVQPVSDFRDSLDKPVPGRWKPITGSWAWLSNAVQKTDPGEGLLLTGERDWGNYELRAEANRSSAKSVGLCFGYQGKGNCYVLRISYKKAQLIKFYHDQPSILAERALQEPLTVWSQLSVRLQDGLLEAAVNQHRIVQTYDDSFTRGKIGLYGEGKGVRFRAVSCAPNASQDRNAPMTTQFTREVETMGVWATPSGAWVAGSGGTLWNKGEYFGDTTILKFKLPVLREKSVAVVNFGTDSVDPHSGFSLAFKGTDEQGVIEITLSFKGRVMATQKYQAPANASAQPEVRVEYRGGLVLVFADSKVVLSYSRAGKMDSR